MKFGDCSTSRFLTQHDYFSLEMIELFSAHGEKAKKANNGSKKKSDVDTDKPKTIPNASKKPEKRKPEKAPLKKKVIENGVSAPPAKKAKPTDHIAAMVKNSQPTHFISRRIAKDFDGEIYFGTIKEYDNSDTPAFWRVFYDDGDQEDYERKDLIKGLKLYAEASSQDPSTKERI